MVGNVALGEVGSSQEFVSLGEHDQGFLIFGTFAGQNQRPCPIDNRSIFQDDFCPCKYAVHLLEVEADFCVTDEGAVNGFRC